MAILFLLNLVKKVYFCKVCILIQLQAFENEAIFYTIDFFFLRQAF